MKHKELSLWLRIIVALCWAGCLVLAVYVMPRLAKDCAVYYPHLAYLRWPCLAGFWAAVAILAAALWEAWLIFGEIGRSNSFCADNAQRLRVISYLAAADTILTLVGTVGLTFLNALHPSIILLMIVILLFGAAATVASAALSHLTAQAAALKAENDLTI